MEICIFGKLLLNSKLNNFFRYFGCLDGNSRMRKFCWSVISKREELSNVKLIINFNGGGWKGGREAIKN